jgi:hypothetical protein
VFADVVIDRRSTAATLTCIPIEHFGREAQPKLQQRPLAFA